LRRCGNAPATHTRGQSQRRVHRFGRPCDRKARWPAPCWVHGGHGARTSRATHAFQLQAGCEISRTASARSMKSVFANHDRKGRA
jgi:hypothetical protein